MLTEGPIDIQERLESASGRELSSDELRELVASIPLETIYAAQSRWFPNLYEEVEAHRDGDGVAVPEDQPEEFEPAGDIVDSSDWVETGGWFIEGYTVNYRLTGHAARFARAWTILAANAAEASESMAALSDAVVSVKAPGGCVSCHSIDHDVDSGESVINWKSFKSNPNETIFTEFVHSKHFSLIGDKGCATCHTIDSEAD